jgi:hypothetical protein
MVSIGIPQDSEVKASFSIWKNKAIQIKSPTGWKTQVKVGQKNPKNQTLSMTIQN